MMINAPTPADVGRVYTYWAARVVLVNDRGVDQPGNEDHRVTIKHTTPDANGEWPVVMVDYDYLTATDEWITGDPEIEETWPLAGHPDITNDELRDWVEENWYRRVVDAKTPGPARLEVVRLAREHSYIALARDWNYATRAAALAILDTPIAQLAAMVVMSDTVLGNWRTIAATVSPVVD